jgi:hypothetical protein
VWLSGNVELLSVDGEVAGAIATFRDATEVKVGRDIDRATRELATRLVEAPLGETGAMVDAHLAEVGAVCDATRVLYVAIEREAGRARATHDWSRAGTPIDRRLGGVPLDLLARLLRALRKSLPDHLGRRPLPMALDLHQRPYYGKKNTKGVTLRQKKASTRKSFTYATLAVLDRGGRFTVGLLPTRPHMRWTTVVERLLQQAQEFGLQVAYLMLDKDFYSAEVIALLQQRGVAFLMPAQKRGGKAGRGNRHLFGADCPVGWYEYTWTADLRRMDFRAGKRRKRGRLTVTVRMCVARRPAGGKALVYAAWGLSKWAPAQVVQAYRKRFGIEAQYRQLGQCLARTSARGEGLRLLLVGLALLLGNLWAYLHSEVFSRGPAGSREVDLRRLRLAELIAAVAADIAAEFGGWVREWPTQRPLPDRIAAYNVL